MNMVNEQGYDCIDDWCYPLWLTFAMCVLLALWRVVDFILVCMHIYIYMYICIYVYIYIWSHICAHVYTYRHT